MAEDKEETSDEAWWHVAADGKGDDESKRKPAATAQQEDGSPRQDVSLQTLHMGASDDVQAGEREAESTNSAQRDRVEAKIDGNESQTVARDRMAQAEFLELGNNRRSSGGATEDTRSPDRQPDTEYREAEQVVEPSVIPANGVSSAGDPLTYSVSDDRFEIADGALRLKEGQALDHEAGPVDLTVTVSDPDGLSQSQSLTLTPEDVNEGPTSLSLDITGVAENDAGALIGRVSATDPDGDPLTYSVSDDRFEIADGALRLKEGQALDHEAGPVDLTVTVSDPDGLSQSQSLTLTPEDVNEGPTSLSLDITGVAENDAGALIGRVSATDPDGDPLTYSVSDDRFEIADGALRLKEGQALDHEAGPVDLTVTVSDPDGLSQSQSLTLTPEDVNEGPTSLSLDITGVAENDAGALIGRVSATDPDGDPLTYSVSDDRFEIADGALRLKEGQALDHEAGPVDLTVTVSDPDGLSQSQSLTLTPEDVNEGPTSLSLDITGVAENDAGALIGRVSATDPDGDPLTYSVSDDRFEIADGALRLKEGQALDHEAGPVDLTVTVSDPDGLSQSQSLTLTPEDVNEGPTSLSLDITGVAENDAGALIGRVSATDPDGDPLTYSVSDDRFEIADGALRLKEGQALDHEAGPVDLTVTVSDPDGLSQSQSLTLTPEDVNEGPTSLSLDITGVAENDAGALIGRVSATDPDGDPLTYSVSDDRFEIADGALRLKEGQALDHEAGPVDLTVTVSDPDGLSQSQSLTLTPEDVNEGPTSLSLDITGVAENDAGALIGRVSATDPDGDPLTYSVSDDRFEIADGALRLKEGQALDHEAGPVDLTVTVSDPDGLSQSQSLTLTPEDVNEGPTSLSLDITGVAENDAGALIGRVSATDPDGDPLTYSVSDDRFEIADGALRLKEGQALDHEAGPVDLTVTVSDPDGLSQSQSLTLTPEDVNEGPTSLSLDITGVAENDAGALIGRVSATDPDGDPLTYSVSDDRFEIADGALRLKEGQALDHEAGPVDLTVTVSDPDGLSQSQSLTLTPEDVNEGPTSLSLDITGVAENDAGALIGRVSATDPDGDPLTYSVSDDRFEIADGALRLKEGQALDHEAGPVDLTVTVSDPDGLSQSQSLTLTPEDVNEGPTSLSLDITGVAENDAGALIGRVSATDPDGDPLTHSVSDDRFEIADGALRLKEGQALDHEAGPVDLTVTVSDPDGLSQSQSLTLTPEDVNEGPTSLSLDITGVAENDAGALIGRVSATDPDGDPLTYSVSDDRFEIADGALRLKEGQALDHEAGPVDLTVTVSDPDGLSQSQSLTLTPEDVNEGPTSLSLDITGVAENDAGALIGRVSATDPDGDPLTYSVSDDRFEIADGALRLKEGQALDHEAGPVDLTVTVSDPDGLSQSQSLTLTPEDVNEGPTSLSLDITGVAENDAGALIGRVSATDPDGDPLTYSVSDDRFEIADGALRLKEGQALDHEAGPVDLTVTVSDPDGLSQSQSLTLTPEDVNEGPTSLSLDITGVAENDAGALIGRVSATDPDGDPLTYSVSDDRFEIADGALRLKEGQALDHEAEDTISIDVTGVDKGGESITETFEISVLDLNDAPSGLDLAAISPNSDGLAIWLDARDIDGDGIVDGEGTADTSAWIDKSGNSNDAQLVGTAPEVTDAGIALGNVGSKYTVNSDDSLNQGTFAEKTFAISFETGDDLSGFQMIYEQGGTLRGYSLSIAEHPDTGEPTLYGLAYNGREWADGQKVMAIELGTVEPNQEYSIALVHDARAPDLADRVLEGYLDGELAGRLTHVDVQYNHPDAAGIGNLNNGSVHPVTGHSITSNQVDAAFDGTITEIVSWNRALSPTDIAEMDAAFDANRGDATVLVREGTDDGTVLATLTAADQDAGDVLSFALVNADGSPATSDAYEVVGNEIRVKSGAAIDHEASDATTLHVEVTDGAGGRFVQEVTVSILDVNEGPTDIEIDNASISETASGGTLIGSLTADDPDVGDLLTFMIVDGDNRPVSHDLFEIVGENLYLKEGADLDEAEAASHDIRVAAQDSAGNVASRQITIEVESALSAPPPPPDPGDAAEEFALMANEADADAGWVETADGSTSPDPDASDPLTEESGAIEEPLEAENAFTTYERNDW